MCICIFPRSDSPLNIGTLLKSVARACADCMQLLILPKPKCYCKVIYLPQISQAEVYQNQNIWLANTITLLFHLVFTPFHTKNAPKEPLGISILTVFFFLTRSSVHAAETSQRLPCGQQQKQIFQLTE